MGRLNIVKISSSWGAWVAQPVKHPTPAQVITSQSVSSSPASGCVLTARSLVPASDSVSPSLFAPPPLVLCLSACQKINKHKKPKQEGTKLNVQLGATMFNSICLLAVISSESPKNKLITTISRLINCQHYISAVINADLAH